MSLPKLVLFFVVGLTLTPVVEAVDQAYEICRQDKSDGCRCELENIGGGVLTLRINCMDVDPQVNTTNLVLSAWMRTQDNSTRASINLIDNGIDHVSASSVTPGLANKLRDLYLDLNKIARIDSGAFDALTNFRSLSLARNVIGSGLHKDWLSTRLGQTLTELDLGTNKIIFVQDGVFDNLRSLQYLGLGGNPGILLSDRTFGPGLGNLTGLDLSGCGLTSLPDRLLQNTPKLTQLDLGENPLSAVPAITLRLVPALQGLYLYNTKITQFVTNTFGNFLPNLNLVDFNRLGSLTRVEGCAFCGLGSLQYFYMDNAENLTAIDENAFGFVSNAPYRPQAIEQINMNDGGLLLVPRQLLPWTQLSRIAILGNPARCNSANDWLFRNNTLNLAKYRTRRYTYQWCQQCTHDVICRDILRYPPSTAAPVPTTKPPVTIAPPPQTVGPPDGRSKSTPKAGGSSAAPPAGTTAKGSSSFVPAGSIGSFSIALIVFMTVRALVC